MAVMIAMGSHHTLIVMMEVIMSIGCLTEAQLEELYKSPITLGWPIDKAIERRITSPFGWREHPVTREHAYHGGIDIAVSQSTSVLAPFGGTVAAVWCDRQHGGGCSLVIEGRDAVGRVWRAGFAHLESVFASRGSTVRRGDLVAASGGTPGTPGAGRSTGPHLHMVIKCEYTAIDPIGRAIIWADQTDTSERSKR